MFGFLGPYGLAIKVGLAALLAVFLVGLGHHIGATSMEDEKDKQIAALKDEYDKSFETARDARDAANAHAKQVEEETTAQLAVTTAAHTKEMEDEHAKTDALVAAYGNGSQRMRVAIAPAAARACSSPVPGTPAPASGGDDQATGELSSAAAAGVAAVAGHANDIVHQLDLAQDTLTLYYAQCGPQAQK